MDSRMTTRKQSTRRVLARKNRHLQPIRRGGGSAIITIPKPLMSALDLSIGDHLLIQLAPTGNHLTLEPDTETSRDTARSTALNLKLMSDLYHDMRQNYELGSASWNRDMESLVHMVIKHLRGETIERKSVRSIIKED